MLLPRRSSAASGSVAELEQRVNRLRHQVEARIKQPGAPLKSAPFHTATTIQTVPGDSEVAVVILTSYGMACRRRTGIRVGFSAANWRLCLEATPPPFVLDVMLTAACFGQTAPNERPFAASKAEVDRALRSMQAAGGGRLPTLEGFMLSKAYHGPLQRPHYTYSLDVLPKPSGSLVRVRAHITAGSPAPRLGSPATRARVEWPTGNGSVRTPGRLAWAKVQWPARSGCSNDVG